MSRQKQSRKKARETARKARRQARLAVGPVPPARVIDPRKKRKPKHRSNPEEQDGQ